MVKSISTELRSHLDGAATSLATLWKITRRDGTVFRFTDHDADIPLGGETYEASVGYNRTSVSNEVGLSVDNLDVEGFLDSSALTERDLRAGLFDHAEVRISIVNWKDLTQGELKVRRGRLGEVVYSDSGTFQTELRGLTQVYSQRLVQSFQAECRADLGDSKCRVAIDPPAAAVDTDLALGDHVKFSAEMLSGAGSGETFLAHYDATALDEVSGETGSLGTATTIQSSVAKFSSALEMIPVTSNTEVGVEYTPDDAHLITAGAFTIEAFVRTTSTSSTSQVIMSRHDPSPNRGWYFQLNVGTSTLALVFYIDGSSSFALYDATFAFAANTWYHVAVCRDESDNVRLFVDGVQVGSTYTSATDTPFDGDQPFRVGRYGQETIGGYRPFFGYIDEVRMDLDAADYTANFTPPAAPYTYTASVPGTDPEDLERADFDDRIYEVTEAGTTGSDLTTELDSTLGATTVWGSVTFTAREAWTKAAAVASVTDNRVFTLSFPNGEDSREVDDWFKFGAVLWDTGDNAGTVMEVKKYTAATNEVELFLPMSFPVEVGDKLGIYAGCDKRLATCADKFDNVLNFRGEPHVPGQDEILNYPDAR